MIKHSGTTDTQLRKLIRNKRIAFAGNQVLKIYGLLSCSSGKRMKKVNRVFFSSKMEAIHQGYRPCGHCLKQDYITWKNSTLR